MTSLERNSHSDQHRLQFKCRHHALYTRNQHELRWWRSITSHQIWMTVIHLSKIVCTLLKLIAITTQTRRKMMSEWTNKKIEYKILYRFSISIFIQIDCVHFRYCLLIDSIIYAGKLNLIKRFSLSLPPCHSFVQEKRSVWWHGDHQFVLFGSWHMQSQNVHKIILYDARTMAASAMYICEWRVKNHRCAFKWAKSKLIKGRGRWTHSYK